MNNNKNCNRRSNQNNDEKQNKISKNQENHQEYDLEISDEYIYPNGFAEQVKYVDNNSKTSTRKKDEVTSRKTK